MSPPSPEPIGMVAIVVAEEAVLAQGDVSGAGTAATGLIGLKAAAFVVKASVKALLLYRTIVG